MKNRTHLVWIGQNATTGTPNRITGRMSMYGDYKKFKSAKERDEYMNQWHPNNPSEYIVKCSVQSGRQYSLGCSMRDYLEYLDYLDYTVLVSEWVIDNYFREYWSE